MRDGKLYLNANKDVQSRWMRDANRNIMFADRQWPDVKARLEAQ